jgi:hypothetical protein
MKVWRGTMAAALRRLASVVEAADAGAYYPTAMGFARSCDEDASEVEAEAIECVARLVYRLCDMRG